MKTPTNKSNTVDQLTDVCYRLAVAAYNSDQSGLVIFANETVDELEALINKSNNEARLDELKRDEVWIESQVYIDARHHQLQTLKQEEDKDE